MEMADETKLDVCPVKFSDRERYYYKMVHPSDPNYRTYAQK